MCENFSYKAWIYTLNVTQASSFKIMFVIFIYLEWGPKIELLSIFTEDRPGSMKLEEMDIGVNLICHFLKMKKWWLQSNFGHH